MKATTAAAAALLAGFAYAFPAEFMGKIAARSADYRIQLAAKEGRSELIKRVAFDASAQYVSNQGAHAFNPPGEGDQRGPCPGLNAMANQYARPDHEETLPNNVLVDTSHTMVSVPCQTS